MQTMLVPVMASALPAIAIPEMRFHSVCFEGEVIELFDWMVSEIDDYHAWTIVPAYTESQAIKQIEDRIRERVVKCDWDRSFGGKDQWGVRSCQSVSEADVIVASKEWGVDFDDAASRMMGWLCECDRACDCCCLYSLDGQVPTCYECYRCKPCVMAGETWQDDNRIERSGPCPHCQWT